MNPPDFVIPHDRLPEGFADNVDDPPDHPPAPRPAATVVLMRPEANERPVVDERPGADFGKGGGGGLEILLLRRVRSAGFVPGAWVFPGGSVDEDDATDALVERLDGLDRAEAARRLGLAPDDTPSAVAYYVAALREAFEETGLLVGIDEEGRDPPSSAESEEVRRLQVELLDDEDVFPSVLDRMGCRMDGSGVEYIAHWVTPVAEPRRYDARFFAAEVPAGSRVSLHEAELTDAVWLTPRAALERREAGDLPMVFPTIKTLEALRGFVSPREVLEHFRTREIPTILPRLVRTSTGIGIELPDED